MKTIYLPAGTEYVCVAELLRCVYQTGRDGVYEVYESDAGELELRMKGCAPSKNEMKTQFHAFCKRESIEPTSQIDRWEKNYTGEGLQDGMYEVTVTEAERFAAPFRVSFQVEGPAQTAVTPAPVAALSASGTPATEINIIKKNALIAELEYEWSSIEADISDATRNGLKAAAHTEKHGEWDKNKARAWAVSKGKIKQTEPVHHLASAWPGATTRNTISR